MEIRHNDEYLVCDECRKQCIYGDCPDHGPLEWVDDCLRANGAEQKNQARATLPSNLYLVPSAVGQDQMGVFARERIEKRVMFGPYKGQTVSAKHFDVREGHNYMYLWDVLEGDKISRIVDGSDEQNSNWMRFVNCARDNKEQNLVAVQFRGEIYYKTCVPVEAGSELLVWFDDSSTQKDQLGHEFVCDVCGLAFAGSTFLLRHKSVRCQRQDQASTSQVHGVQADTLAESLETEKANEEEATVSSCDAESSFTVVDNGTATNEDSGLVEDGVQANPSGGHEADEPAPESTERTNSNQGDATLPSDSESSIVVVDIGATSSENSRTVVDENSSYRVVLVETAPRTDVSKTRRLSKGKQNSTPLVNGKTPQLANTRKRSAESLGEAKQTASKTKFTKTRETSSSNGTKARNTAAKKPKTPKATALAGKKRKAASTADGSEIQTKKTKVTNPSESQGRKKATKSKSSGTKRKVSNGKAAVDGSMEVTASGKALRKPRKQSKTREAKKKSSKLQSSLPGEEEADAPAAEDERAEKRPRKKTRRKASKERDSSDTSKVPSSTKRKKTAPEDKPVFTCEQCLRTFKWKSQLDYHVRSHATEKEFKCTFCDKGLSQLSSLKRHLRVHSGEKPYECQECGKRFVEKGKLNLHLRKHKGEQPEKKYKCSVCDRGFTLSANLTTHMRTHTGEKPYPCPQCGKGFKRSSDVISHLRSHTGERPYKCSHCEKSFTMISHRNRHEVIHTGLKPFKCDVCGKGFTQPNSVKAHLKVHAKKQARLEGRAPGHGQQDRTHKDEEIQTNGEQRIDELPQSAPQNNDSEHGAERKGCEEELQGVITELMETDHLQIGNLQDDSTHTQNLHENGEELFHLDSSQGLQPEHLPLVDDMEEQEISTRDGTVELTTIAAEQLQLSCTAMDTVSEQLNTDITVVNEKELLQLESTNQSEGAEHLQLELTPGNEQDQVELDERDETTLLAL